MSSRRLLALAALTATLAASRGGRAVAAHEAPAQTPCQELESRLKEDFVVIFNAADHTFYARSDHRYSNERVLVCVDNPDLRFRYSTAATFKDLPPDPGALSADELSASFFAPKARANLGMKLHKKTSVGPAEAAAAVDELVKRISELVRTLAGPGPVSADHRDTLLKALRGEMASAPTLQSALTSAQDQARGELDPLKNKAADPKATDQDKKNLTDQEALLQRIADLTSALSIWLANADVARRHLSQDLPLVFQVSTAAGKEVSLSVRAEPLVLSAETPPKLGYGSAQDEGSTSFQSRTLSWLRVGLGLTYTQLRDRSYRIGPNEIGAPVIQSTDSASLAPVLYFTHYWNAADTRDPGTPWNSRIPGWERNLLPTLTVGIPLSRSPLENVFLGATIQLVPGIAFSGGVHIGRVTRLRSGFSVDTAPPADPAFRIQDATEPRLAIAPYLAVIVTDTLFVGAIQKLAN